MISIVRREEILSTKRAKKLELLESLQEEIDFIKEHLEDLDEITDRGQLSHEQKAIMNLFIRRYNRKQNIILSLDQIISFLEYDVLQKELDELVEMGYLCIVPQGKQRTYYSLNKARLI